MRGPPRAHRRSRRLWRAAEARVLDDACADEAAASGRHLLGDIAKLSAVMLVVHVFIETPAHEMGHWFAAQALGLRWDFVADTFVTRPGLPIAPAAASLVYVAGGLFAGTVLSVMALVLPPPWRNGVLPLIAAEFAYAPFDPSRLGDAIGLAAFAVVAAWIVCLYLGHYLRAPNETPAEEDLSAKAARNTLFLECLAEYSDRP